MNYIEVDGKPVPEPDLFKWSQWLSIATRTVAFTKIDDNDGIVVSTMFLGIDHNYFGGTPLLYETMIFGGPHDEYQVCYSSREEAVEGHERAVRIARGEEEPE